ncbi:MAG: hypothetical protein WAR24_16750 [Candidatus Acidiferrales bacterium]
MFESPVYVFRDGFDPTGSASFVLLNQLGDASPVPFVLTVEPFLNGVGHPKQSRTITIPVTPNPGKTDSP